MKLSIIIPAYNCEEYITNCLGTIIPEINGETEILIIDDGSTDNTLRICEQFCSENVKAFHQSNQGVSVARNKGLELAKGDYIMFVDSDDRLIKGWFKTVIESCNENNDIVYFSKSYTTNNQSKDIVIKSIFGIPESNGINYLSSVWSKVFKRSLIIQNQILFEHNIINGEDLLFSLSCFLSAKSFVFKGVSIYEYYVNYSSATHVYNDKFWLSNKIFIEKGVSILTKYKIDKSLIFECTRYSFINSLVVLLIRIAYISDRNKRRSTMNIFEDFYIKQGIQKYSLKIGEYSWGIFLLYYLIKYGYWNIALKIVHLKFKKKSNPINKYVLI